MKTLTLALLLIIFLATHARAENETTQVIMTHIPRTDEDVIELLRARIAREEKTAEGAERWHGKRISTKVEEADDALIKYEKYADGFIRTERSKKKPPLSLDEYSRVIEARRQAMLRLADREPNVPKALRDARRKAIEDLKVVTNTVVTIVGDTAENGANEQK